MGRGRSGLSKKSGGGNAAPAKANTPSGIDYNQFMAMTDAQKYQTIDDILNNSNIKVPSYLDSSDTNKVIYGLGMANKPTVVSDSQLDAMPGKDLYRTVYESGSMPPPSSAGILDQIRNGDYTQLSGKGGSVHGRALYFARDDFSGSTSYGMRGRNAMVMRAKINPNAKIVSESKLDNDMRNDTAFHNKFFTKGYDEKALYALSHGIDGWYSGSYSMIINRGALTASSQNKSTRKALKSGKPSTRSGATSWANAANV